MVSTSEKSKMLAWAHCAVIEHSIGKTGLLASTADIQLIEELLFQSFPLNLLYFSLLHSLPVLARYSTLAMLGSCSRGYVISNVMTHAALN